MTQRTVPVCADCGSDEIYLMTTSDWDIETQQFLLSDPMPDYAYCPHCNDEEVKYKFISVKEDEE